MKPAIATVTNEAVDDREAQGDARAAASLAIAYASRAWRARSVGFVLVGAGEKAVTATTPPPRHGYRQNERGRER